MSRAKHIKEIDLISTDSGIKIKCSITGEYELADRCGSCSNFIKIDPVRAIIKCRRI